MVNARVHGDDARVGVGVRNPDTSRPYEVSVLHLLRVGTGKYRPWEVVGTDDKPTFTITAPKYGAKVVSPLRVGGRISGVDESVQVKLLQLERALGSAGPLGAGGRNAPWATVAAFRGAVKNQVIIVVAWAGGHVAGVERFVINGVVAR